jgi:hypothetical protein
MVTSTHIEGEPTSLNSVDLHLLHPCSNPITGPGMPSLLPHGGLSSRAHLDDPPQPPARAAIGIVCGYNFCIYSWFGRALRGLRKVEGGGLIVNDGPRVYVTL